MKGIGGLLVTHQCEEFDYCYRESLQSLIETCDEVVVVDGRSTDGTRDVLASYESPSVRIIDADWNPVVGTNGKWLSDLYNLAKANSTARFQIGLQADEVLHEMDSTLIRQWKTATSLKRLNFWRDSNHYLMPGRVCGSRVFRFGDRSVKFVNDAEGMDPTVRRKDSDVCIFHYGFLRRTKSLIEKSINFEYSVFGAYNPLFDQMKTEGRQPFDAYYDQLIQYTGPHPKYAHEWLEDRGFDPGNSVAARSISPFIKPDWTGVEIGVWLAFSARHLLRRCAFMHLIDPCHPYEGNPDSDVYANEREIAHRLSAFRDRYRFIKGMSHEVHDQIPEVDFVFVDGNHTYDYVARDIALYWPKVKSGGFLSGHDWGEGFPDVIRAVHEFSANEQLPIEIHNDCWLIRKP